MKNFSELFAIRPKIRKFLTSFHRYNLSFDIENQLRIRALNTTCKYIEENMVGVIMYDQKPPALNHALDEVKISGLYCEFGVFKGETVNHIAKRINQEVHAFDSFEGLPENWLSTHKKGHFKVDNMPTFEKNVVVHKGWFNDTIVPWLANYSEPIAFLHIDCDLYSSTKTIFTEVDKRIVPGTIILFDEYFNYPFWQQHEFKAFQEFVAENNVKYEYLCYNSNTFGSKVAVRILERQ